MLPLRIKNSGAKYGSWSAQRKSLFGFGNTAAAHSRQGRAGNCAEERASLRDCWACRTQVGSVGNETSGLQSFTAVLTSVWTESTGWEGIEGVPATSFPEVKRLVNDENFLSNWVRCIGLTLLGVSWGLAFTSMVLLYYLRKDSVIQRTQPFFMQLLCVGSIIMTTSIYTLSLGEGVGWTDQQLDVACTITPWFFFIGHITVFSALFTKLWRIDQVLQFSRRKVTVRHVTGGFARRHIGYSDRLDRGGPMDMETRDRQYSPIRDVRAM